MPCKNEINDLERTIAALRQQEPPVAAVVVVDNGSTDGSVQLARALADEVLEIPSGTIAALRNRGARAVGPVEVLAFIDSDTEVGPGWLRAGLDALEGGADLVGSRPRAGVDAAWVARRWAVVESTLSHAGSQVWSANLLIRREVFDAVGGFDERLATGEDADLSIRVKQAGGAVALVPEMVAIHHGWPGDVRAFVRREAWHTRHPGWYPRMSASSRRFVALGAGWCVAGAGAVVAATAGRRRPLTAWLLASAAAPPALGSLVSRRPRLMVQDGVLLTAWLAVRVARVPRELLARRRPSR